MVEGPPLGEITVTLYPFVFRSLARKTSRLATEVILTKMSATTSTFIRIFHKKTKRNIIEIIAFLFGKLSANDEELKLGFVKKFGFIKFYDVPFYPLIEGRVEISFSRTCNCRGSN